ncbi:MAG: PP2C family protein-serine/threonine phosphatase [Actinomycetes bacterium]
MQFAQRSDIGYVRTRNEDASFVRELPTGCVVCVADGMGGHPAGDVASATGLRTIEAAVDQITADPETELAAALRAAHDAVLALADSEPAYRGMGTTAVVGRVTDDHAHVAHVGDSRAYLVRGGAAVQVTHDHNRHGYLTQALGIPQPLDPELVSLALSPGDRLLLCTDGLSGLISEDAIGTFASSGPVADACDQLVAAALAAGGYDNVTVVLVEV